MDNDENTYEHWLSIFKQFLIDNKADNFWLYVTEGQLIKLSHPAYWVTATFRWNQTEEGFTYWDRINNLWDGISNN